MLTNEQGNQPRFKWKSTLVIFVVSISALVVVNYSLPYFLNPDHHVTNKVTVANITITVNFQNGTVETKKNISSDVTNATVFDIMIASFEISYQSYSNGFFITRINGASNGWTYKVNGVGPSEACNFYVVENDSIIDWDQNGRI
jgi:hypothetical protein